MRKLLIFPLLLLLASCVSYYYPKTALEDGIYYAEDDPAYVVNEGVYIGVAYYPWSSLDYFYFGYHPYPIYPYYYGFAAGYAPWHYPFGSYGFYSPLYVSHYHYPFYPAWRPYGGYCAYHRDCGRRGDRPVSPVQKRFASHQKTAPRKGEDDETGDEEYPFERSGNMKPGGSNGLSYHVYRPYFPPGFDGSVGTFTRQNESKIGKSMVQPVRSASRAGNISINSRATGSRQGLGGPGSMQDMSGDRSTSHQPGRSSVSSARRSSSSHGARPARSSSPMRSSKSSSSRPRNKRD